MKRGEVLIRGITRSPYPPTVADVLFAPVSHGRRVRLRSRRACALSSRHCGFFGNCSVGEDFLVTIRPLTMKCCENGADIAATTCAMRREGNLQSAKRARYIPKTSHDVCAAPPHERKDRIALRAWDRLPRVMIIWRQPAAERARCGSELISACVVETSATPPAH